MRTVPKYDQAELNRFSICIRWNISIWLFYITKYQQRPFLICMTHLGIICEVETNKTYTELFHPPKYNWHMCIKIDVSFTL